MYKKTLTILLLFVSLIHAKNTRELDFKVQNDTKKNLYVTCFYYATRERGKNWTWHKSGVYKLKPGKVATIDIETIKDIRDAKSIYGYLAVFNDKQSAKDAIYELTADNTKIDLPKLMTIKDKTLSIHTETYGFKGEVFDWKFKNKVFKKVPELDFVVENQSGRDLYATCFVYQKEDPHHPVWKFDKTEVIKIPSGEQAIIDVDTILDDQARDHTYGYLALFDADKEKEASDSTFNSIKPDQKLNIGELSAYKNKKVVIIPRTYGLLSGFDDRYPNLRQIKKDLKTK